jgi:hypothetical protein
VEVRIYAVISRPIREFLEVPLNKSITMFYSLSK